MQSDTERRFDTLMLDLYWMTGKATGYWAHRWLQKVRRVGGLQTARDSLRPTKVPAAGLERLVKERRLDLSLEAIVLQEPWRALFTPEELTIARERLASVGPQ